MCGHEPMKHKEQRSIGSESLANKCRIELYRCRVNQVIYIYIYIYRQVSSLKSYMSRVLNTVVELIRLD
jgi:hypothetical protein